MMRHRDELQKNASESNCETKWNEYKKLRNQVNNKLKYEESYYQKRRLKETKGD